MLDFMENKSATCELIKQVKEANKERTMIDVPLTLMAYFKEDYTVLFVEVKVLIFYPYFVFISLFCIYNATHLSNMLQTIML